LAACDPDDESASPEEPTDASSAVDVSSAVDASSAVDVSEDGAPSPGGVAPLFITTMTHLEGSWNYGGPQGHDKFDVDVDKIVLAMNTFEPHGALLTVESEVPFSTAATEWNSDIFDQLMARGHGVGTHCDIVPDQPVLPPPEIAAQFSERKVLMDALIGEENNLGCSGGQGRNDWIVGAHLAGFKFVNGIVGFAFLSMPLDNRPDGWTDEYILEDGHHHDPVPVDLEDRIHPFMMDDALDLVPDVPGKVLLSAGALGRLDGFAEAAQGVSCNPSCTFEDADIEAVFDRIDEAIALHDPTRVGKMDVYFPLSIFKSDNIPFIDAFLSRLKEEYVDTGKITWATQKDIYDAYISWNSLEP